MQANVQKSNLAYGVAAALFAFLSYMTWIIASPIGGSPDESYYLAGIWCADGDQGTQCQQIPESTAVMVPRSIYPQCFPHWQEISAGCVGVVKKEDIAKVDAAPPGTLQTIQSIFVSDSPVLSVLLIRSLMFGIVFLSLLLLIRNLDAKHRFSAVLVFGVAFIPMSTYLITSINPSGLAIGMTVIGILSLSQLVKNDFSKVKRVALTSLYSLAIVSTWLTRKEATVAILISTFIVLFVWAYESRIESRRALFGSVSAILLVGLFLTSQGKRIGIDVSFILVSFPVQIDPSVAGWNVLSTNLQNFPSILIGNFGYWGLGAIDTPMPILVWSSISMVMAALVGIALFTSSTRVTLQFTFLLTSTIGIILFILQRNLIYVGDQLQPRYVAPLLMASFALLFANTNWIRVDRFHIEYFKLLVVLIAASANSIALWTVLRRYISGLDVGELDLTWQQEWWWNIPISPNQVWFIGTVCFGSALYLSLSILLSVNKVRGEAVGVPQ